ncbi:MAG: phosphate/phosphite/phosphonate ABC transporter substrate-binding protein [Gammaproteobacteria bacterium]|nr:phosphate/phosphite/phosphonate ABC transporter substrate-binding protein [Gammaproteobacteria bacterium]
MRILKTRIVLILLTVLIPQTVFSAYLFTAPPRETAEKGNKVYSPIASFLTKTTGKQFIYKHQHSWAEYARDMRAGKYDLVFDGPHFVDWRIHNIEHNIIVKIPHLLRWRVITQAGNTAINKLDDLIGEKTCAPGSPNFGMLNLFSHFRDPEKQPIHVEVKGWNNVYENVKNGTCVAGVLPKKNHEIFDKNKVYTKSIHTHLPYPNQAITASKRIPDNLKEKIRAALLSEDGHKALKNLRQRYTGGTNLVKAEDEEYDSIHMLLLNARHFSYQQDTRFLINQQLVNN